MGSITYNGKEEPSLFGVLWKKIQDLAKAVVLKKDLVTEYPSQPVDPDHPDQYFTDEQVMSANFVDTTYQKISNLVTAFQIVSDDTHYPSEKLVVDTFQKKQFLATVLNYLTITDNWYPSVKLVNDNFQRKMLLTSFQTVPDDTHYLSEKAIDTYVRPRTVGTITGTDSTGNYIAIGLNSINLWDALQHQTVNIQLLNSGLTVTYMITAWAKDSSDNYTFVTNLGNFEIAGSGFPKLYI